MFTLGGAQGGPGATVHLLGRKGGNIIETVTVTLAIGVVGDNVVSVVMIQARL